jgi:glutamate/tyrosine decarboxylase-like PLP-dependent enzyme
VADPILDRDSLDVVLRLVAEEAAEYLARVDDAPVRPPGEPAVGLDGGLPTDGDGSLATLRALIDAAEAGATRSAGPRFFHFVMGGGTPAALGADWLTSALDQIAFNWVSSPFAMRLEQISTGWLKELFGLPAAWSGVFTTGATMANFVGLAAARQWWGEQHGVDVAARGLSGLPPVPVFASGLVHASDVKVCSLLGIGREHVRTFAADAVGHLDAGALERALQELDGAPAILIGSAGEVNAGEFDPIDAMADLARRYRAWLHVDGAFGLFARLSERTRHLAAGVERADSVTVDGHKWLNVPYDCGYAFVRDLALMGKAFAYTAAYLPSKDDPRPTLGAIGPESSRRARALATWATLRAYGRRGYRELVERHLDLAQHLASLVDAAPDLERLAEVPLNIVCFRSNPGGLGEAELDAHNRRLGEALLRDGRVWAGTTSFGGRVALRPAISNWRTRREDLELFVDVVRGQAARQRRDP